MADITMCSGVGCPLKEKCYRFKAIPCEFRQSYFTEPPLKNGKCEYFSKLYKKNKNEQGKN